jgi:pectinesterase inhibitor-like protein
MASCVLSFSLLFLIISCQSLFISAAPFKHAIDEVCYYVGYRNVEATEGQLCHLVLDTDPRSRTANKYSIGIITANIAVKNATMGVEHMKQFLKATNSLVHQKAVQTCVQAFRDIIPKLNGMVELMKSKSYSDAYMVTLDSITECYDNIAKYPSLRVIVDNDVGGLLIVVSIAREVASYLGYE